jgi:hypothetical protein
VASYQLSINPSTIFRRAHGLRPLGFRGFISGLEASDAVNAGADAGEGGEGDRETVVSEFELFLIAQLCEND